MYIHRKFKMDMRKSKCRVQKLTTHFICTMDQIWMLYLYRSVQNFVIPGGAAFLRRPNNWILVFATIRNKKKKKTIQTAIRLCSRSQNGTYALTQHASLCVDSGNVVFSWLICTQMNIEFFCTNRRRVASALFIHCSVQYCCLASMFSFKTSVFKTF